MDNIADWESVLQYVTEPIFDIPPVDRLDKTTLSTQMPTPPVSNSQRPVCATRPLCSLTYHAFTYPHVRCIQLSHSGSPMEGKETDSTTVSVSTTFYPSATSLSPLPPDVILFSSDAVFFYTHCHQIATASTNCFHSLLPQPSPLRISTTSNPKGDSSLVDITSVISVTEPAQVLNILLHAVYDISCAHYCPTLDTISAAVCAMVKYGISVKKHISPSTHLYSLILSQAPIAPLEAYTLAAEHDVLELAMPVSSHLLSYDLSTITDEIALRMGPIYLRRLFFLHLGRADALKRLLLPPPHPHPECDDCDFAEQKKLTRAWALAAAYLAWDARPGG